MSAEILKQLPGPTCMLFVLLANVRKIHVGLLLPLKGQNIWNIFGAALTLPAHVDECGLTPFQLRYFKVDTTSYSSLSLSNKSCLLYVSYDTDLDVEFVLCYR